MVKVNLRDLQQVISLKKKIIFLLASVLCLMVTTNAHTEGHAPKPKKVDWSFNGPFGTFDRAALQRGLQVYREVCSSCHAIHQIRFGNLKGDGKNIEEIRTSNLGLTEAEAVAIAGEYKSKDLDDEGQPTERKSKLTDKFPAPYPNEKAARAVNNGANPADLSMVVKARVGEADYIYSLLMGFDKAPDDVTVGTGQYYNHYFPGNLLSMAPPLHSDGQVTYADGTKATIDQMAMDVTTFLTWASDPSMEDRKQLGVKILFYLFFLTIILYFAKRKIWKDIH